MEDNGNDNETPYLADLHVSTVRRENDHVDDEISSLEDEVSSLQDEVAALKSERDGLEDEKEAAEELLEEFSKSQREAQLQRIRAANEQVDTDDEIDLEALEDADADQLEVVAEMLENAAEAAGTESVSNTGSKPNVSGVEREADDIESKKDEVAKRMGLAKSRDRMKNGDTQRPEGIVAGDAAKNGSVVGSGRQGDVSARDLLEEIAGGDS